MGTRFLATEESDASDEFKTAVVAAKKQDIIVVLEGGSPCGYPFRILRSSPMWQDQLEQRRPAHCDKGYLVMNGQCLAREDPTKAFCICNGLLAARGYNRDDENPMFTVGANAWRLDRILPVSELMAELAGDLVGKEPVSCSQASLA
jgi:nitronate monooxygenase